MGHGDITHVEIPVQDLDAAKAFYTALFGWDIQAPPGFEDYPMWRAPTAGSGGGLTPREASTAQPRAFVEVDSIEETLALAEKRGGSVHTGKRSSSDTSWWAVFADPDGNLMGLYEDDDEM